MLAVTGWSRNRAIAVTLSPRQTYFHHTAPNQVWCADFKGQFKTKDGLYCYPLTIADGFSRYLLGCQALLTTACADAKSSSESYFASSACPNASALTTEYPLPPSRLPAFRHSQPGGFDSAFSPNSSNLANRNKMAATNECIAP